MQITTQDQEVIVAHIKDFAEKSHGDQRRKYSGERYMAHLLRVMNICYLHLNTLPVLSAALLHDVVEDTPVTARQLEDFLHKTMLPEDAETTLQLVLELTDVYTKKAHPRLNRAERKALERQRLVSTSPEAQTIKYADIIDNAIDIVEHDPDFAIVFLREYYELLRDMNRGDQLLYREAVKTVRDCLVKLNQ